MLEPQDRIRFEIVLPSGQCRQFRWLLRNRADPTTWSRGHARAYRFFGVFMALTRVPGCCRLSQHLLHLAEEESTIR